LRKEDRTWDDFLYQFLNPRLTVKIAKTSIDFGTANPSHPHPPKSKIPPVNPTPSSSKNPKNPIVDPQLSSTPIESKEKKMKDSFYHDFPPIPTKRRGANRFKGKPSRMCTRSMVGKFNKNPPITLDPIQLSSDHEIPHKKLK
jgi:hypothetical protein